MKRISASAYVVEERVDDLKFSASDEKSKSKTVQSDTEDCDVNNIVARALKTGILGDPLAMAARVAQFGDFSGIGDFHSCVNRVHAAQKAFDDLPAAIKVRFNNDPGQLIEFLADPASLEEAVSLGLLPQSLLEEKIAAEAKAKAEAAAIAAKAAAAAGAAANPQA